ncbi:hypothetical protein KAR91_01770, partial [Candidatus Pacearchaeota archaeon]|nr:hypothetical protein [Candidatus Pacearchaeota archaeon]
MNHKVCTQGRTKRKNTYILRGNRKATGYGKVLADCAVFNKYPMLHHVKERRDLISKLSVYGTLDELASFKFSFCLTRETVRNA